MRMSDLGFTYSEIIHYCYKNVHIIDLSVLDFLQEYYTLELNFNLYCNRHKSPKQ